VGYKEKNYGNQGWAMTRKGFTRSNNQFSVYGVLLQNMNYYFGAEDWVFSASIVHFPTQSFMQNAGTKFPLQTGLKGNIFALPSFKKIIQGSSSQLGFHQLEIIIK
jgi:hypothetical protein